MKKSDYTHWLNEKSIVDLLVKQPSSSQGNHLNKFDNAGIPNAVYHVSRPSAFWFQRSRFLKVFTIYGHGGHLGHVA